MLAISARDFLDLQLLASDASTGTWVSVAHGIEHSAAPPHPSFIRGDVKPGSGWKVEVVPSDSNASVMTYVIFTDIKGWVRFVEQWAPLLRWSSPPAVACILRRHAPNSSLASGPAHACQCRYGIDVCQVLHATAGVAARPGADPFAECGDNRILSGQVDVSTHCAIMPTSKSTSA